VFRRALVELPEREDGGGGAVKRFVARYVPLLWLLAVLSLVGWFIWNGDLAGWILLALVIGLMVWQLTGRDKRGRRDKPRRESADGRGIHDEPAP
jgi:hypothetical protein